MKNKYIKNVNWRIGGEKKTPYLELKYNKSFLCEFQINKNNTLM